MRTCDCPPRPAAVLSLESAGCLARAGRGSSLASLCERGWAEGSSGDSAVVELGRTVQRMPGERGWVEVKPRGLTVPLLSPRPTPLRPTTPTELVRSTLVRTRSASLDSSHQLLAHLVLWSPRSPVTFPAALLGATVLLAEGRTFRTTERCQS